MHVTFDTDAGDDESNENDDDTDTDSDTDSNSEVEPDRDAEPPDHPAAYAAPETRHGTGCRGPETTVSLIPAEAYPSPLSATDLPAVDTCRGKLRRIPKAYSAPRVAASASPSQMPPTTQNSQGSTGSNQSQFQLDVLTRATASGHAQNTDSDHLPRVKSFAEIQEENTPVVEDFSPHPLEQDFMELWWKHETPARPDEDYEANTGEPLERNNRIPTAEPQLSTTAFVAHSLEEGRRRNEHSMLIDSLSITARGERQPSTTARPKRRAESFESRSKRPSFGLRGQRSNDPASDPCPGPSTRREKASSNRLPSRTFMSIRSLDKMEPNSIHRGCVAGQPCKDHDGGRRPTPRDPLVKVYHNTLDSKSRITVEQAEYILSRSNCYWAWTFTWIWKLWCDEEGGIDNQVYSQVELLLDCSDKLKAAAWDCCPPGQRLVIDID